MVCGPESSHRGSKHLEVGARKIVLTAPGMDCPTHVVSVDEGDYDAASDAVVSYASCTFHGVSSVCKVLDPNFGVKSGPMTATHSYTRGQIIWEYRDRDLRRARAGAYVGRSCIVPGGSKKNVKRSCN